jgi:hypothetical protein
MATLSAGTASFVLGAGVKASGRSGQVDLPEGTRLTIDLRTGACVSASYPDGRKASWDAVKDHVRPEQVPAEARSALIKGRAEAWIAAHPEASDGSNRDLRTAYSALRDRMAQAIRDESIARAEAKCLAIVSADKLAPDASVESAFASMVDRAGSLPAEKLKAMGEAMAAVPNDAAGADLGAFDRLGSILSKAGIHPFAARNIYYFPDGTGQRILARRIESWPSGSPKAIVIEPPGKPEENMEIRLGLPYGEGVATTSVWVYGRNKLDEAEAHRDDRKYWAEKGLSWEYWSSIDRIEFSERGRMIALGGIPYSKMPMTKETGCTSPVISVHNIRWNEAGRIVAMYPSSTVEPVMDQEPVFRLPGGIEVVSPRWILWWDNESMSELCYVQVNLDPGHPVKTVFKKGPHTLFKQPDPAKMAFQPYEKNFDKDTPVTIKGGFYLTESGELSYYW